MMARLTSTAKIMVMMWAGLPNRRWITCHNNTTLTVTVTDSVYSAASNCYLIVRKASTCLINHLTPILTSGHSDAQGWASECTDVKNYKWRLNQVCDRTGCFIAVPIWQQRASKGQKVWWTITCLLFVSCVLHSLNYCGCGALVMTLAVLRLP